MDTKDIQTGVGNPLSPYTGELLSEEDEKRLDEKGHLVVRGLTWGEASSGIYLTVALHERSTSDSLIKLKKAVDIDLSNISSKKATLTLATSVGKPVFSHSTIGAALELPSDLANDDIKRQYVIEWLVNTVDESLKKYSAYISERNVKDFSKAIAEAAESAVRGAF